MKQVFFVSFLLFFVFGCIEITPKIQATDPNQPAPVDQNFPLDFNMPLDQNNPDQNTPDLNFPVEPTEPPEPTEEYCRTLENKTKIDTCLYNIAITKKEIQFCSLLTVLDNDQCRLDVTLQSKSLAGCLLIKKEVLRNECLSTLGIELKDISFCNEITGNQQLKISCIDTVYTGVPASGCRAIEEIGSREDCLFNEAKNNNDYKICGLIAGSIRQRVYYRDQCLDQYTGSFAEISACNLYFDVEKEQACIESVALKINNLDACSFLSDKAKSDECIKTVAIATSNQFACNKIEAKTIRQECFEHFAEANPSAENCEEIADAEVKKTCYKNAAVAALNDELCDLIADQKSSLQTSCYVEIAKATNNTLICKKIYVNNFNERDDCFSTIATATLDFEVCENIHFGENYVSCFSSIAVSVSNYGICNQMEEDYFTSLGFNPKYGCFKEYAIAKNNIVVCDLISPTNIKNECKAALGG